MSDWLKPVLDKYDRQARLKPALLCGLPLVTSIVLLIPEFGLIWGSIGGVVVYCGGAVLLIQIGRDLGKALEQRLFQSWAGTPSAAMLRHTDCRLPKPTKDRYRKFLNKTVPGLSLASPIEEERNPGEADAGYESANRWLLEQTRDHARFHLLFTENMNYGFRRTVLALRPIALGLDAIGFVLLIVLAVTVSKEQLDIDRTILGLSQDALERATSWASVIVTLAHTLLFAFYIRADYVRSAAERYAHRLLSACDALERATGT